MAARPSAAAPVDHALPTELAEGAEKVFGFPIPRRMQVTGRFPDVVFASGPIAAELVASYVRDRVVASRVEAGPERTFFSGATLKKSPERTLQIDVVARDGATDLVIRDVTPPPAEPNRTEEERWRAVGLTPDGKLVDPTRLE